MKLRFTPFIMTTLFTCTMHAAMQAELYPYAQKLELQTNSTPSVQFGSFTINEDLFSKLNPASSNLRIIDHAGTETPFLLRTKKGERKLTEERKVPFKKISFKKLPDNQIEIIIQNEDHRRVKPPLQSLVFANGIRNFEKSVSVYSSDNQQEWKLIAERKPIFDYSKYIDIRNNRITFKPVRTKFFKIIISNITEKHESPFTRLTHETRAGKQFSAVESSSFTRKDFKINEIYVYEKIVRIVKGKTQKQAYSLSNFLCTTDQKKTFISFSTASTPITTIDLSTATPYYYRSYSIETSPDQETWRSIHSGIIASINTEPESRNQGTIKLPRPIRAAHYRITIRNNDSPPLDISGAELEGVTQEIIFYCDQQKNYSIIYGAEDAKTPVYDIAQVLTKTESDATAAYKTEAQSANPSYGNQVQKKSFLSRRAIMTIAVLLMIAVLGWLIFKTAKSID